MKHFIYIILIITLFFVGYFIGKSKEKSLLKLDDNSILSLEGKTGDDLNKAFLLHMIPHHIGAVEAAKFIADSSRPELVQLSREITYSQSKEISDMKKWLQDWFNIDYDKEYGNTAKGLHSGH